MSKITTGAAAAHKEKSIGSCLQAWISGFLRIGLKDPLPLVRWRENKQMLKVNDCCERELNGLQPAKDGSILKLTKPRYHIQEGLGKCVLSTH